MSKRISICCPFCRRRMKPYSPEGSEREEYWLCVNCKAVFSIEQMPWYPITEQTKVMEMMK